MARLGELRGRVLGCYCKPLPCHGDVLAALADGRDPSGWPPPGWPPPAQMPLPGPQDAAEPLLTAWQYADRAGMLTGEGDAAFVADLQYAADYVARRRGLPWQHGHWPGPVWRDVADAMGQRAAESGEMFLDELELDAVADGYLPDPQYRSRTGFRPTAAEFMQPGWGDPPGDGFWGYPAPPEGTQAHADWLAMAAADGDDGDIMQRDDPYVSAWDPGWPPMSSEDM